MLLGRQLVALEERQNYSLGLRKKKIARIIPFPSQHFLTDTSLGECFVQEYLSRDWCVFACTCEGGETGRNAFSRQQRKVSTQLHPTIVHIYLWTHTDTHCTWGVIFISSSQWSQTSWIWLHLSFNSQVIRTRLHDYNTFQQTAVQYYNI